MAMRRVMAYLFNGSPGSWSMPFSKKARKKARDMTTLSTKRRNLRRTVSLSFNTVSTPVVL
jgi:hypothetical protein